MSWPRVLAGVWVAGLVGAGGVGRARGSTYDTFGFTARDVAMGSAMTGASRGYSGLFYNPAALVSADQQQLGLGLTLTVPELYVDRVSADGAHPTVTPDPHVGFHLGWVKPVPGVFDERVAIGFGVYLPATRLVRVEGVDPQSPQFYRYQNLQDKLLIHGGLAVTVLDGLSLGLGVQVLADLGGVLSLDMDIASGSFTRRDLNVSLTPTAAPFAGLLLTPMAGLSVGLSYRGSSALQFDLPVIVREGEAFGLEIGVSQTVLWTPDEVSVGASYLLANPRLLIALDVTWARWSAAPDPSARLSVDITGRLLDAFGLSDALDLSTRSAPIEMGLSDTLVARVGVEWQASDWLILRGGYFFRPTPVPRQSAATAYLDNDAHVLSVGAGFSFHNPLLTRSAALEVGLAAQLTLLPRRAITDRDPRDPVGDLAHGGLLWTFSATISHRY